MKFLQARMQFGKPKPPEPVPGEEPDADKDNGEGLPKPHVLRAKARRMAGIKEARAALDYLPQPGESVHIVCTARLDLSDIMNGLIELRGHCRNVRIATLGYNEKNLRIICCWLDEKTVDTLSLLTSKFFRAHKRTLFELTVREFRERGQRLAATHSHAKVATMDFADGSKWVIHGSANLSGNGSGREQFEIVQDAGLHDWSAEWIEDLIGRTEGDAHEPATSSGPGPAQPEETPPAETPPANNSQDVRARHQQARRARPGTTAHQD